MSVDLHRHDMFSLFDGFDSPKDLAKLAKELGYTSLATSNHGNMAGIVKTYTYAVENELKPILGIEAYMLPVYKEKDRGYHICLFAKNLKGYGNINRILFSAENKGHKYYNTIISFDEMEKFHEGVICTSACIAGYLSAALRNNKYQQAKNFVKKMKSIFGDDFYIEIQPYKISEEGVQEDVNVKLIKLSKEMGVKCILTSDSHRGRKEDFDSYEKMHQIGRSHGIDIRKTYFERYMPKVGEMEKRFIKMHAKDFGEDEVRRLADEFTKNLDMLEDSVEDKILDELKQELPSVSETVEQAQKILKEHVRQGLAERGKWTKEYKERAKMELEVIMHHGFEDYFLMVADYVKWAKDNGIAVGPGRGSVCNCLVAYALRITEVDSLLFDLDFRRFLRMDKDKLPDIDLDFETKRRHDVIEYLCEKYKGHAARISSYGLYKTDNLINDLAKVCGLPTTGLEDEHEEQRNKEIVAEIKSYINTFSTEIGIDLDALVVGSKSEYYNSEYDNIIKHFSKMYKRVRYFGTHAAGVAITGGKILDYIQIKKDNKGDVFTAVDLADLDNLKVIKFDILGLVTMESIGDLREATGVEVNYDTVIKDEKVLDRFSKGDTVGVFQLSETTPRKILDTIHCDSFADVVAGTSMNRPGPLQLGMPEKYGYMKENIEEASKEKLYEYTQKTYGTIVYQEQMQQICINVGKMSWKHADKMLKLMKNGEQEARNTLMNMKEKSKDDDLEGEFIKGAMENGYTREDAKELFDAMLVYSFNEGHGVGYTLISFEEMYYKVYHPTEFWFSKIKFASSESDKAKFQSLASADGAVIFLPHVNYSGVKTSIRQVEGQNIIQQGLADLKGVGDVAAQYILEEKEKNGIFISYDNFIDRCIKKGSKVNKGILKILKDNGALEFNKKVYIGRVIKYNSSLYSRARR